MDFHGKRRRGRTGNRRRIDERGAMMMAGKQASQRMNERTAAETGKLRPMTTTL